MISKKLINRLDKNKKRADKLHTPSAPRLFFRLILIDPQGKEVYNEAFKCNSYVRNAYVFYTSQMLKISTESKSYFKKYGAGGMQMKSIEGTVVESNRIDNAYQDTAYTYFIYDDSKVQFGAEGDDRQGIVIGSGNTAENFEDYKLASQIRNGKSSGQLYYNKQTYSASWDSTNKIRTNLQQRIFANCSGADIVINESGIYMKVVANYIRSHMFCRDVFTKPINVPKGYSLKIQYYIQHIFPDSPTIIPDNGTLYGCGYNKDGEAGIGKASNGSSYTPDITNGQIAFKKCSIATDKISKVMRTGSSTTCIIDNEGYAWFTGRYANNIANNNFSGGESDSTSFIRLNGLKWKKISMGLFAQMLGIRDDGTLWAIGPNPYGVLGTGNTTSPVNTITQIGTDTWIDIYTGFTSSYGIKSNGTLWTWGENYKGSSGLGTTGAHYSPIQVGTELYDRIFCGASRYPEGIYIRAIDGSLWGWGYYHNMLGDGSTSTSPQMTPIKISSTVYDEISCSPYDGSSNGTTYAIRDMDNLLVAWGNKVCGNGTSAYQSSPIQITTNKYRTVYARNNGFVAISKDLKLYACGDDNINGQLGLWSNNQTDWSSPILVGSGSPSYYVPTNILNVTPVTIGGTLKTGDTDWISDTTQKFIDIGGADGGQCNTTIAIKCS